MSKNKFPILISLLILLISFITAAVFFYIDSSGFSLDISSFLKSDQQQPVEKEKAGGFKEGARYYSSNGALETIEGDVISINRLEGSVVIKNQTAEEKLNIDLDDTYYIVDDSGKYPRLNEVSNTELTVGDRISYNPADDACGGCSAVWIIVNNK